MREFDGKSVVITGAGGGLGRGLALAFSANGADVIIAARGENGAETQALVEERGGKALWVKCDVTRREDVDAAVRAAVQRCGHLDVMIHNAMSRRSSETAYLESCSASLWQEHASVTLRGAFHCLQSSYPELKKSKGRLIYVSTPAGMEASPSMPLYGVTKGGLRGFTKSAARELGPDGINVNAISPLTMTSGMSSSFAQTPGLEERYARIVPRGYFGDPELDLGGPFMFLAGAASRYVTGQTFAVDGGRFMAI